MKSLVQAVKFLCSFAILGLNPTAYSAPSIPDELRESSLIYCTNASSFSLNPQQADMGTNVNVVTDQLYDKLFELDPKTNQLKPMFSISDETMFQHFRKARFQLWKGQCTEIISKKENLFWDFFYSLKGSVCFFCRIYGKMKPYVLNERRCQWTSG